MHKASILEEFETPQKDAPYASIAIFRGPSWSSIEGIEGNACFYRYYKLLLRRYGITSVATNQVSFLDDELPLEGRDHTLAMHIVVNGENKTVARVIINNWLALNVCPMATLECLKVDMSLIKPSTMIIKAFNGTRREVQGEIGLMIEIVSRSFMVNFQEIKVDSPYNMLLERP